MRRRCLRISDHNRIRDVSLLAARRRFGTPASRATLEDVAVMQQAVKHGADGGDIAQQFAPVLHRTI